MTGLREKACHKTKFSCPRLSFETEQHMWCKKIDESNNLTRAAAGNIRQLNLETPRAP